MLHRTAASLFTMLGLVLVLVTSATAEPAADLILHGGKIVTVDRQFTIHSAIAVRNGRVQQVGDDEDILAMQDKNTQVVDLDGKMVLPGLIDSHVHPNGAAMIEFDHPVPEMHSIQDVLDYVAARAEALEDGQWIEIRQVFITRLKERRYPTRAELDRAAPHNPVLFATGPDASLNTLALERSGIDRNFQVTGHGFIEKDPSTGEPTGILRSCTRYVKVQSPARKPSEMDRYRRLAELLADYNSVGITAICDRSTGADAVDRYRGLLDNGQLTLRVAMSRHVETNDATTEQIQERIRKIAAEPLVASLVGGNDMLQIIGIKTFLDGGMLTGSAYMSRPWGVSQIYSITDPAYRGVLFIPKEKLLPIVQTTVEAGFQFTAHAVGDAAVETLLDVYEEVDAKTPVRDTRPCITHSNFMSAESLQRAARLGVVLDIQPVWLYLDTATLVEQFGYDRLRYFQPLASIFKAGGIAGGGSDHMQKIGSLRSVNPYNPFLGMHTAITRRARNYSGELHPEEALTREQAIRFYTHNNAIVLRREQDLGSLEPGKFADLIVLDTDLLTCEADDILETQVLSTYLGGKQVYTQ